MSLPASELSPSSEALSAAMFASHLASLGHLPAWWRDLKAAAWKRFAALPMPARGDELWRFSSVAGLRLDAAEPAPAPDSFAGPASPPFDLPWSATLAFVNGRPAPAAHAPAAREAGVIFCSLEEAIASHADLFRQHFLAQPVNLGSEKFSALNAAFASSGAFLYVPRNVEVALPFAVVHRLAGPRGAVYPHTLVVLEDNAKATLVECFVGDDSPEAAAAGGGHFAAGQNDLHAGPGAQLTYVGVQQWPHDTLGVQLNSTVVQRDARVRSVMVHLGGRQVRHESHSRLQGPGGFSEMLAVSVARGAQEYDQRTLQSHLAPNTGSNLLYKNVLLDQARTIFSGLIVVDPDAQKTDAYQSNRNLLLSDDAEANALPGLEIQANDVRCTHGATSGHLDAEQMFYLRSRGIPVPVARDLLVAGFLEDVIGKLEAPDLQDALRHVIHSTTNR